MKAFALAAFGLLLTCLLVSATGAPVDAPTLTFSESSLSFSSDGTAPVGNRTVTLTTSDNAAPLITLSDDPHAGEWLVFPAQTAKGELTIGVKAGLAPGTYQTSLFATANGFDAAELPVTFQVTAATAEQPRVTGVFPPNGLQGVSTNTSISANALYLPNGQNGIFGVDNESITTQTVRLFKLPSGTEVPATVNGTGGGDAINLTPLLPLEPNTSYLFTINGVKDLTGAPFELFYSTFRTDDGGGNGGGNLEDVAFVSAGPVGGSGHFTSLTVGPDGLLYALSLEGVISRWTIEADGTLSNRTDITTLSDNYGSRSAIGFTFAPTATASQLVAYVTHVSGGLTNGPAWDGKISRLSGPDLADEDLIVTNLPRSRRDHLTNSIAFRPGEDRVLYFLQGSNTAGGAPDKSWGNRKERLLSAAALRLDLDKLPESAWPLNAKTTMNAAAINAADVNSPTLGTGQGTYTENGETFPDDGTYNPYYREAPLTLYATGVRNAYDLVWHSNGQLYIPTNGTAGGSNSPASIDGTRRPDGTFYRYADASGAYPVVPEALGNNTQRDWLFRIDPTAGLGYYGHPNPLRGQFVMNRGAVDVDQYPAGVLPDDNYRGAAFDFEFNKSPNGVIEYQSNAENGALRGALIVCRYSGGSDLIVLKPDGPNGDIGTARTGVPGFTGLTDPLDLTEDPATGNLYVSDFGVQGIILLKPSNQATPQPAITLNPEAVLTDAVVGSSASTTVFIANTGNAALENATVTLTGPASSQFALDATSLPSTLAANSTASVEVRFVPTSAGAKFATLTLVGSNTEPVSIPLSGLGKNGTAGDLEPSLQHIFDVYQLPLTVGDQNPATPTIETAAGDYNLRLGDEADVPAFVRATDGPVTVEVLSVFAPQTNDPVLSLGWYETGDAASTTEVLVLGNGITGNGQTLQPKVTGGTSFDPGSLPFGFYTQWPVHGDRTVYSEDSLNTFTGAVPRHVRVYPLPGEENAYLLAFEATTDTYAYQDVVVVARNVEPVPGTTLVAAPGELLFETTVNTEGVQTMTKTVSVTNQGRRPLSIIGVALAGPFADQFSVAGPTAQTLAPAAAQTYTITYAPDLTASDLGHQPASLVITTDVEGEAPLTIGLHGLKKAGYEGNQEPALQSIVDVLGYGIDVGWTTLAHHTLVDPQGDEAIAPIFEAAAPGPVTLRPLARYSPAESLPFGYYTNGGNLALNQLGVLASGLNEAQTLFPSLQSGYTSFVAPAEPFGIFVESKTFNRFNYTEDGLNTEVAHRVRVYPARDRSGTLLPHTYLVCFEDATNGDYQDYVFLLSNARPVELGSQVLRFAEDRIALEAPTGGLSAAYPTQLTASVPLSGQPITLSADQPWVVLPQNPATNTPLSFAVNAIDLQNGHYEATVVARAQGYVPAILQLEVFVKDEVAYAVKVNFQDGSFTPPAGYLADAGAAYGMQGQGLQYGWIDADSRQPASNTGEATGSLRGITNGSPGTEKLMHSFNMFDYTKAATRQHRLWEVAVPNGRYRVETAVGDATKSNSRHSVRAEGVTLIEDHKTTSAELFEVATGIVEVIDGKLTIDDYSINPDGNTKIIYLTATQLSGEWSAPALIANADGPRDASGNLRGAATIELLATAASANAGIQSLTYSVNGAATQPYTQPLSLSVSGSPQTFRITARAVDTRGRATTLDTTFALVPSSGARLRLENLTKIPGTNRSFPADNLLAFHRFKSEKTFNGQRPAFWDNNRLRLHNEGTASLVIQDLGVTDPVRFTVEGAPTAGNPLTIPAGGYTDVTVRFIADEPSGVEKATFYDSLRVVSNADNGGEVSAHFRGAYSEFIEGINELTNQHVFEALWFGTEMGRDEQFEYLVFPSSDRPTPADVTNGVHGDLILSDYFEQADPNKPVRMVHLGAFHGFGGEDSRLLTSSGQTIFSYNHGSYWFQTILPRATNSSTVQAGNATNTINGPFQVSIAGYKSTGGNRSGNYASQILGIRMYAALDHRGEPIPNEYIVLQDYIGNGCAQGGGNCDWQDNVAYLINARPVNQSSVSSLPVFYATANEPEHYEAAPYYNPGYPGNRFRYSATLAGGGALPHWVQIDRRSGRITARPPFSLSGQSVNLTVTGADNNGRNLSANLRIEISTSATPCTVNANADGLPKVIFCQGTSVQLRGDASTGVYRWTGPNGFVSSLQNPVVTTPGTYQLASVTMDGSSCGTAATVTVTEDFTQGPPLAIDAPTTVLGCTVGSIDLVADSESENPTYVWYAGTTRIGTGAALTVTEAGTYTVEATAANGCRTSTTINITEDYSPPSAGNDGSITVCAADAPFSLFDELSAFGGNPQSGGSWTFYGEAMPDTFDPATGYPGTYTYWVGGRAGCPIDEATLSVSVTPATTYFRDADGDGFGDSSLTLQGCVGGKTGYVSNGSDCNDGDASVHPGAGEACDGLDNNCDGQVDEGAACVAQGPVKRINAGGPEVFLNGLRFEADQAYYDGYASGNSQLDIPSLYQTMRTAGSPYYVRYYFPMEAGEYRVRLHFAETYWGAPGGGSGGPGSRVFDVVIEGNRVLNNYDIAAEVGSGQPVVKEFTVNNSDGNFFMYVDARSTSGGVNQPLISGFEVISTANTNTGPNQDPVAVVTAEPGSGTAPHTVRLDGSASSDPDGSISAYEWSWAGGTLSGPSHALQLNQGSHTFSLTVTDDRGAQNSASVTVTVGDPVYDADGDGIADAEDNCPTRYNPDQSLSTYYADADADGLGDPNVSILACVPPTGYVDNALDLCPEVSDPNPADTDNDGLGDACDPDDDNDGVPDTQDCAPLDDRYGSPQVFYADLDGDGFGDPSQATLACVPPQGYVKNRTDNCPATYNPAQTDTDGDGVGDACPNQNQAATSFWLEAECGTVGSVWTIRPDPQASNGRYVDAVGNYNLAAPPADIPSNRIRFSLTNAQAGNYNLFGRVRAANGDGDSFFLRLNGGEWVKWSGGITVDGNFNWNLYRGGTLPLVAGTNTLDIAWREGEAQLDKLHLDLDATLPTNLGETAANCNGAPNVPPTAVAVANPTEGPAPLTVTLDASGSSDSDGQIDTYFWEWPTGYATGRTPTVTFPAGSYPITLTVIDDRGGADSDELAVLSLDAGADTDGDGFADLEDSCPTVYNPDQQLLTYYADFDGDGFGDPANSVQSCEAPDGYVAVAGDNCPTVANPDQADTDNDGLGDACDNDSDNDGVTDANDCAPTDPTIGRGTLYYADQDGDGFGDPNEPIRSCTPVAGYVTNADDNCPYAANPDQADSDNNGVGDVCEGVVYRDDAFWLEAECAVVGSAWTTVSDAAASNGEYVHAPGNSTLATPPADIEDNHLRFLLDNAAEGSYQLFARISAPNPDNDSYWVRVNNGAWFKWSGGITVDGNFNWNKFNGSLSLVDDINLIDIAWREGGAKLDKLYLAIAGTLPTTLGEDASNCGGGGNSDPVAVAKANPTSGPAPLAVSLNGSESIDIDGSIVDYAWAWNGGTASGATPQVSFPTGNYVVTLTVTDDLGAVATDVVSISVYDPNQDADADGVPDATDNCPAVYNPDQQLPTFYADHDGDGYGDPGEWVRSCTPPANFVDNADDNCPYATNPDQADSDNNGVGDVCEGVTYLVNEFWLEGECATVGSSWTVGSDPAASNEEYVHAPGQRSMTNAPADVADNQVRFFLDRAEAGSYHLFARISAANADSDSYWVRLNDGAWIKWSGGIVNNGSYQWNKLNQTLALSEGVNVIDFAWREGDARLDKIHLGLEATPPTGLGTPATNCGQTGNRPPLAVADATPRSGPTPLNVTLDGTGSSDIDGNIASYAWSWEGGSTTGPQPQATFPAGSFEVTLTVTDDLGLSNSDQVTINVYDPSVDTDNDGVPDASDNCPTVANPDQSLPVFYADFDGDGLGDPNDQVEACTAPANYVANADDRCPTVYDPTNADSDGDGIGDPCDGYAGESTDYAFEAECATVGGGWITVSAPEASAGSYAVFQGGNQSTAPVTEDPYQQVSYSLEVTESATYYLYLRLDAPDGNRNSLWVRVDNGNWMKFWRETNGDNLQTAGLEWRKVMDDRTPVSFALAAGSHTVTIANREAGTMVDKVQLSNADQVPIALGATATNCGPANEAPTAVAGASPTTGVAPLAVTLDATASSDPDGSIVDYAWSWTGGSASGATATATFTAGTYNVSLIVTDDQGAVDTDVVVISVTEADTDNDGVADGTDNCPTVYNPDQTLPVFYADFDGDGLGDPNDQVEACTAPANYVANANDNCPTVHNPDGSLPVFYADFDGDGLGDPNDQLEACTAPANYVANADDRCPSVYDPSNADSDGDGIGDACETAVTEFGLEAECGTAGSGWMRRNGNNSSNGSYLEYAGNSYLSAPQTNDPSQYITYSVAVEEAGTYRLFARINAPSLSSNSLWIRVDNGNWIKFWKKAGGADLLTDGFEWHTVNQEGNALSFGLTAGNHTITVINREAGTGLDKLVLAKSTTVPTGMGVEATNCNSGIADYAYEANCGSGGTGWEYRDDATASGGSYRVFTGSTNRNQPTSTSTYSQMVFTVDLAQAANYHLFIRMNGPVEASNSFWVRVDNGSWIQFWQTIGGGQLITDGFEWRKVNHNGTDVSFNLSAGTHTITIANREAGTGLDKLLLSKFSNEPDGFGPTSLSCGTVQATTARTNVRTTAPLTPTSELAIEAYPNPTRGTLNVSVSGAAPGRVSVRILGPTGQVVRSADRDTETGTEHLEFRVEDLPSGMYFLRVTGGDRQVTRSFIKVE
ncbi:hypothetical protein GGR26_002272 [Lewinella marina]|uniref:Uncharacterized protein n=1 Tax=Neolewinella marina TaxID=438751 RepID=A0A2G0CGD7_9BACT|nr:PKD domain-containing protein [Neolewinella marina]NJB86504.1 hypothetical protein [Neolewinella marina]PHK99039.1 hypothetical protein CGL56_06150 [Neolewinella marina]